MLFHCLCSHIICEQLHEYVHPEFETKTLPVTATLNMGNKISALPNVMTREVTNHLISP